MRESQPEAEIPLQDTTAEAFTMLLRYIYTGRATLTDEKEEVLLDFLSLAHKYGFPELEDSTSEYLCTILNIQNVCMTFDVASLYSLPKLTCMCCMFMDRNAQEVLASDGFLSLSKVCSARHSVRMPSFLVLTGPQNSGPRIKGLAQSSHLGQCEPLAAGALELTGLLVPFSFLFKVFLVGFMCRRDWSVSSWI